MNSTFQFWTVSLVLFFAIYGVLQNPKNSHEMLNFNTIEPREYRLFRRCGAFNRKRWQLALHCHLRSPVPLVVLGFNLKFCSVNPYSTHTANFSKIKKSAVELFAIFSITYRAAICHLEKDGRNVYVNFSC